MEKITSDLGLLPMSHVAILINRFPIEMITDHSAHFFPNLHVQVFDQEVSGIRSDSLSNTYMYVQGHGR